MDNKNVDYRFEEARLKSYKNWPVSHMDPARLAASGFYYTGENDKVTCFECKLSMRKWDEGDQPEVEHLKWRSMCRFISEIPCGNVPIGVDSETIPHYQQRKPKYGKKVVKEASASCSKPGNDGSRPKTKKRAEEALEDREPKHLDYINYQDRLKTVDTWPQGLAQSKESLATAGFFYTGKSDRTLCYCCGGGLTGWNPLDIPWAMHALWFPKCRFLRITKGIEYIKQHSTRSVTPPALEETVAIRHENSAPKKTSTFDRIKNLTEHLNKYVQVTKNTQGNRVPQVVGTVSNAALDHDAVNKVVNGNLCKCCRVTNIMILFHPCGHAVVCNSCAVSMWKCLSCKVDIQHKTQIAIIHQYYREKDMIVAVPTICSE